MGIGRRLSLLAEGALAGEVAGYLLWRPRMLRRGATAEEATEPLPGDGRTPQPRLQSTRAITIDAPPEQVWPDGRAAAQRRDPVDHAIGTPVRHRTHPLPHIGGPSGVQELVRSAGAAGPGPPGRLRDGFQEVGANASVCASAHCANVRGGLPVRWCTVGPGLRRIAAR